MQKGGLIFICDYKFCEESHQFLQLWHMSLPLCRLLTVWNSTAMELEMHVDEITKYMSGK